MRRIGMTAVWFIVAALTAAAQTPELKPGVVVRVFELSTSPAAIPDLVVGELPNAAEVRPQIDFDGDVLGRKENFLTEITGVLNLPKRGGYHLRLISDDGSRLYLGERLVIDHDGLHGATPKDALLELGEGPQAFRIRHFQGTGGATLRLHWKPPGDEGDFRPVPAEVFTHDAGAALNTAPGQKRIIPPLRRGRPGDGSSLLAYHPLSLLVFRSSVTDEARDWVRDGRPHGMSYPAPANKPAPEVWVPAHETDVRPFLAWELDARPFVGQRYIIMQEGSSRIQAKEHGRIYREEVGGEMQGVYFRCSSLGDVRPKVRLAKEDFVPPFEMLAVRAMSNGMEVEFTEPLDPRCGWEPDAYYVEQWPFDVAGGKSPHRDGISYPVKSASVSEDRKRVFLEIEGLKPRHVIYLRLLPPVLSERGALPWSTEAWYTANALPTDHPGTIRPRPAPEPANLLTDEERAAGWRLLFDGKTTSGWHGFPKRPLPDGWKVLDGCLVRVGPGGDIITDEQFENFELKLEWRISAAGNSGIFYRVSEEPPNRWVWETGPEMQVLDNAEHADGRSPFTSAGSNYALYAPERDATRPVGLFNEVRLVVQGDRVEHWLNGTRVVTYELNGDDWRAKVAASKFKDMPRYGSMKKGGIALQDHGDRVWYRNIKIRTLD